MNIQTLTQMLIDSGIQINEAKCEIKMLLEHFCDYSAIDKVKGKTLSNEHLLILKEKVEERVNTRLPIQYIIGESWFMGEYFKVTKDVLIPRDETEILVRKAIDIINKRKIKNVLDIGTGSGCIACTIAKNTDAVVLGVDTSVPVHHSNVYPSFVGLINVISPEVTSYDVGLFHSTLPQFNV